MSLPRTHIERILDALPSASALLSVDGVIVAVSPAWLAITRGVGRHTLTSAGDNYLAACDLAASRGITPAADVARSVRRVLAGDDACLTLDYAWGDEVGRRSFRTHVVRAGQEAVVTHEDLTASLRAAESISFQARLLDTVGQAVIATDPKGVVLYWNRAAEHMYGWPAGEALGQDILDLTVADDAAGESAEIMAKLANGQSYTGEFWARHRDSTRFRVQVTDTPVHDEDGRLIAIVGVSTDISDRYRAEISMRRLSAIVESSGDAITATDSAGLLTSWNAAAEVLYGYRAEEVIGKPAALLAPDSNGGRTAEVLAAVAGGQSVSDWQISPRRKDGSTLAVSLTISPVYDDNGVIVGAAGISRDVSEGRRWAAAAQVERLRLASAQRMAHVGSLELDLRSREVWWSEEYRRILGLAADIRPTEDVLRQAVHPDDRERVVRAEREVVDRGAPTEMEYRICRPSGEIRWVRGTRALAYDPAGEPSSMVGTTMDVTDLRRAEEERRSAEERFRLGFDRSPIGMGMVDLTGHFSVVNPALGRILGRPQDVVVGTPASSFVYPPDVERTRPPIEEMMAGSLETFSTEMRFVRPDGELVWVQKDLSVVRGASGEPGYFFIQAQDITARKVSEQRLAHQASHDPLTGLPNRLLLAERIGQAIGRTVAQESQVVVLLLDVDNFKVVNDGMGHAAGDELLVQLAARLQDAVRAADTLARFGGDEFVIVYEAARPADVDRLVGRIAEAMRAPFTLNGRDMVVTLSTGIAVAGGRDGAETVLRNADAAMYRAKERGRARAVRFDNAMHRQAKARLDTESGLRRALSRRELVLYYQPILSLDSEEAVGFEALVRWQHPTRGLVSPKDFIPIAEETGLILPIGQWVMGEALAQAQRWRQMLAGAAELGISVNLSARQLLDPDLRRLVAGSLASTGIPPSAVLLEITESVVMKDVDSSVSTLAALRSLGVRLAIDDFGTGYSSLSYLKRLPVTTLKIDRSFVDGLGGSDRHDPSIVDAIVNLARALELDVVAEGVETPVQRAELVRLGAGWAQGYLWGAPMPAAAVPRWLATRAVPVPSPR